MPNSNGVKIVYESKGARKIPATAPNAKAGRGPSVPPAIIQPSAPKNINAAPGELTGRLGHGIIESGAIIHAFVGEEPVCHRGPASTGGTDDETTSANTDGISAASLAVAANDLAVADVSAAFDAAGLIAPGNVIGVDVTKAAEGAGGDDPIMLCCSVVIECV